MIIAITRKTPTKTSIQSDAPLNEEEKHFLQSFVHILEIKGEYTLYDMVKKVHENYDNEKADVLIESVTKEYGQIKREVA